MGDAGNLIVDSKCVDGPHQGNTCYKITYKANNGWAGIFWQSPANNWGNMEGGCNLSGAKKISFWAKGEKGGEEINIAYGGIVDGNDKKSFDTNKGEIKALKLSGDWKEYSIDLSKKDMSNIISGFVFTLPGKQQVIYLDDIQYE